MNPAQGGVVAVRMEPGGGRASVHGPARRLLAAVGVLGAVANDDGLRLERGRPHVVVDLVDRLRGDV